MLTTHIALKQHLLSKLLLSQSNVYLAGSAIHSPTNCTLKINYLSGTLVELRSGWFCCQGHSDSQMGQFSCGPISEATASNQARQAAIWRKSLVNKCISLLFTEKIETKNTQKQVGWISSNFFVYRNQHKYNIPLFLLKVLIWKPTSNLIDERQIFC